MAGAAVSRRRRSPPPRPSTESRGSGIDAFPAKVARDSVAQVLASGVDHETLIRKAAAGLAKVCADELRKRCGGVYGRRVILLVGTGNNGADALFAGALLARRGVRVDALLTSGKAYGPGVRALKSRCGRIFHAADFFHVPENAPEYHDQMTDFLERADVLVDGIVGDRGRSGGLGGFAGEVAYCARQSPDSFTVVAADLPSGLDPDSGEITGPYVTADVTVSFGEAKPCLLLPPACKAAGTLVRVDIGLPQPDPRQRVVQRWDARRTAGEWPVPMSHDHKYTRGVLGVVAGSDEYPGAGVLACLGAVRVGVGMVRYLGPPRASDHVLIATPEVVPGTGTVQAWLLGPGVEPGTHQNGVIAAALDTGGPCVVDAGALAACVQRRVRGEHKTEAHRVLLTPHTGELATVLTQLGHDVDRDAVNRRPAYYARLLATEAQVTVLLKGTVTLVVGPQTPVGTVTGAPAWLATAGAGDVLAGIAGALMAQGIGAYFAGQMAAYVHGRAAARANSGGPLSAGAVAAEIPATVTEILKHRPL